MAESDNTILLRVSLDEGKTTDRLKQLVLDIEATKNAQKLLTQARKENTVTDAEYAAQTVLLQDKLNKQRQESTALTKNLDLYNKAVSGVGDTYKATQAQLSLAQRQYQELAGSASNSTEETQALGKVIEDLRNTLKTTDSGLGLFVRNVGNYQGAVEPLIAELKRLEIQQAQLSKDNPAYEQQQMRIVGFQQAINRAGAEAGLTYEQTQAKLKGYGDAIAPVVQELVKLEKEQQQVAEGSEQYNRIGFQMQKLKQDISEVPAENKKLGDSLADLDEQTGAFGGQVANLKGAWQQAKAGAESLKLGLTGVKGAFAATGIGLFVIALGLLFEYFTKTDEGAEDLAAALAFLKGGFSVLEGVVIGAGKALVLVFTNPKQAAKDLIDFLGSQVMNRIKAFGVIWDAIRNGDARGLQNGILQYATGVEDSIGKTERLTAEIGRAAAASAALSRAEDDLDQRRSESLTTLEKNKNLIDKLVLSSKDRSLSEKERLANLDKASALEIQSLSKTIELAKEAARIARERNQEAIRQGKTSDELRDAQVAGEVELLKLEGQSATLQQSIQNRRSALLQQAAAEDKAAADKARAQREKDAAAALAARQNELKVQLGYLDLELAGVQKNSQEELNILQRKLATQRTLELTAKDLTVRQKALIDAKYEADSLKLTEDFAQRQLVQALGNARTLVAAQLTVAAEGSDEELRLRQELLDKQLAQELAALDKSQDNTAKEKELRANTAKAQADLEFNQALTNLENELQARRNRINQDYASGLTTKQQQEAGLAAIERAGLQARLVAQQDYGRSVLQTQQQIAEAEAAARDKKAADDAAALEKERGIQQARMEAAGAVTDTVIELFGEETAAGQAALALKKVMALAEIAINLQREISAIGTAAAANPLNIPTAGIAGITQNAILTGLAIAKAAVLTAKVLVFRRGGMAYEPEGSIAQGPSHEQGGIPLYSRRTGRSVGIEIEGGEPVLTAAVSRTPHLLAAASAINVAAGGRPLVARPLAMPRFMALGGVAQSALVRESLAGPQAGIDYERLGQATAKALRQSPPITRISDVKDGLNRDSFTEGLANS
ncbi:hypothetical protein [Hymenobacter glacieicola]|uniref:Uncharacterized protein n=1 Tax=Hymenobacter glacieicola TaxID=1562124 RepID=A0ABQ1WMZ7_9BACT|nr:hypothetical protein [Hymenobacter glacieicola]GGG34177.1 hypothetical protein GCM10011378_08250 [Hymenobacter glacieicola]